MLVSKQKDGSLFSLADKHDRAELERLAADKSFFCPVCGNAVKMKLGKFKRWHFAHVHLAQCENSPGGRESEGHLEAKRQLFTRLEETGEHVLVEPYLADLRQRPDLLVTGNSGRTAIEYQNSIVDSAVIQNRIKNYRRAGIESIWLLGENHLKRLAANRYRITNFHWLFAQQLTPGMLPRFLFYSPVSRKLLILHNVLPVSSSQALALPADFSLSSLTFPHLYSDTMPARPFSLHQKEWLLYKQRWRYSIHRHTSRKTQQLNRKFYRTTGKPLSACPPQAGIPLKENSRFAEAPIIWQLHILLEAIMPLQPGSGLPLQKVIRIINGMIAGRKITVSAFSCNGDAVTEPVRAYLDYLAAEGTLQKMSDQIYMKKKEIVMPESLDNALLLDKQAVHKAFDIMSEI